MLGFVVAAAALLLPQPPPAAATAAAAPAALTRRMAVQAAAGGAALALGVRSSSAAEPPSKLGGLLEPYIDVQKGYKLYKPSGWNQFDADPGVYDIKFQDIIETETFVQVSSSPVQSATSVDALGELDAVGEKFAKSRNAQLVKASTRDADGSLMYIFELQGELYHENLVLTINRGKLFRLTTVTGNKKWKKREELYKNIVLSFVPKGF